MERLYKAFGDDFLEFYKREIGISQPRYFARRISASEVTVKRLDLYGKLNGHEGCVNTIDFNATGDVLASGSDDRRVILWDWATRKSKLSYQSGHMDNIFQAKFMPFTDDRRIVTAAADGQVRLGLLLENGQVETKRLGRHQGRVHKLAVEPGSPYIFYSCGEDGFVQHYDLRSNSATKIFCCSSFAENNKQSSSSISLNAIVIDPRKPNYFAVGGSDEYARVYDVRMYEMDALRNSDRPVNTFCPPHLIKTHDVHITALAYSSSSELLVSYNDELIYLFQKNMGLGPSPLSSRGEDAKKLEEPQVYSGHRNSRTIKGKKGANLVRLMVGDWHIVNQLEPHPCIPVLATCGIEKTIKLWTPSSNNVSSLPRDVLKIMEANRRGREDHSQVTLTPDVIMHVLRLQRRQGVAYVERRHNRDDVESDEDDGEGAYILGFPDGDTEEGVTGNSECSIS
ncbi:hypothetical protein A4A49_01180 [Nicotiana attenuata]|uniref:Uncharacterized protein n=1 Tax=Nicotiana attenuata TaxID=49451 RepID=A0A314L5Z5_NICAT|nr:hypothetical protein A4A49_01180 [Nicotiana attenuata]